MKTDSICYQTLMERPGLRSLTDARHEAEDCTFGRLHVGDGLTPRHHSGCRERRRPSFHSYLERGGDIARPEREFSPAHPVAAHLAVAVGEHQHPGLVRGDRHGLVLPEEGESEIRA